MTGTVSVGVIGVSCGVAGVAFSEQLVDPSTIRVVVMEPTAIGVRLLIAIAGIYRDRISDVKRIDASVEYRHCIPQKLIGVNSFSQRIGVRRRQGFQ